MDGAHRPVQVGTRFSTNALDALLRVGGERVCRHDGARVCVRIVFAQVDLLVERRLADRDGVRAGP